MDQEYSNDGKDDKNTDKNQYKHKNGSNKNKENATKNYHDEGSSGKDDEHDITPHKTGEDDRRNNDDDDCRKNEKIIVQMIEVIM